MKKRQKKNVLKILFEKMLGVLFAAAYSGFFTYVLFQYIFVGE